MDKQNIKEEILKLGCDNVNIFNGLYEGGIYLQQNINEITELIYFLKDKRIFNFLEIGSASGGNTFILNKYLNFNKIVIVDDNKHSKSIFRKSILNNINYIEYIGDSQDIIVNNFIKDLNIKFDLIFIDADHTYNGVKKDTFNFMEFLNKNGYMIFHDTICVNEINKWIEELKNGITELKYIKTINSKDKYSKGITIFKK